MALNVAYTVNAGVIPFFVLQVDRIIETILKWSFRTGQDIDYLVLLWHNSMVQKSHCDYLDDLFVKDEVERNDLCEHDIDKRFETIPEVIVFVCSSSDVQNIRSKYIDEKLHDEGKIPDK